jgi:hypothetical protein
MGSLLSAEIRCEETDLLRRAYRNILELHLDSAQYYTQKSRSLDPDNILVELLESYDDFLRGFINEDEVSLERFRRSKSNRLDRLEKIKLDSPYIDFMRAEINLQWALVRSKHKEYIRAGWDINRAYKLLIRCKKEYPDFMLADKSLSVIHSLVGSIQGFRRGLMRIFTALDGSIEDGLEEINRADVRSLEEESIWRAEILIIKSLLQRHIDRDPAEGLNTLKQLGPICDTSPLVRFLMGACTQDIGDNDAAIEYWSWETTAGQLPFYYMDFVKGIGLLNKLDNSAKKYLLRYIHHHPGEQYQKEARQKMAWYELIINDDIPKYKNWMLACLKEGITDFGEDQQAYQEAKSGIIPNISLLRARLLYDGGQFHRAMDQLSENPNFKNEDILECHYRKARILHAQDHKRSAILEYIKVISEGDEDQRYYACNAALQVGLIMTELQRPSQAKHYFEVCISMHPEEYQEALHQKARLGLQRLHLER